MDQLVDPSFLVGCKPGKPEQVLDKEEHECGDEYLDDRFDEMVGLQDVPKRVDGQQDSERDHEQADQPLAGGSLEALPVLRIFQAVCVPPSSSSCASHLLLHFIRINPQRPRNARVWSG